MQLGTAARAKAKANMAKADMTKVAKTKVAQKVTKEVIKMDTDGKAKDNKIPRTRTTRAGFAENVVIGRTNVGTKPKDKAKESKEVRTRAKEKDMAKARKVCMLWTTIKRSPARTSGR